MEDRFDAIVAYIIRKAVAIGLKIIAVLALLVLIVGAIAWS